MAWIYSVASEASLSDLPSGYDLSHIVRSIDTAKACFCLECMKGVCQQDRYGMTCEHCHQSTLEYPSISSREGFLARTSALLDLVLDWTASGHLSFLRSHDYVAIYDRDSFSWRTSQLSLFGGLTEFSWSSLRSGMTVDGRLYQPQSLEPHTLDIDGFYLPTPTAQEYGTSQNGCPGDGRLQYAQKGKMSLSTMARRGVWATPTARDHKGRDTPRRHGGHSPSLDVQVSEAGHHGYLNPAFVEVMMGYPKEWTVLAHWAMQWFRRRRGKRLED